MRRLIGLLEQRDKFVSDQGQLVNRLSYALKQYYPQVLEWFSEHNTVLFSPLPGAAKVLAPRLLAAFGEDRQRYPHADALQKYSGIAPVTKRALATRYCSIQVA
jgi:hypothetical protein